MTIRRTVKDGCGDRSTVLLPDASICGIDVSILDFRYTIPLHDRFYGWSTRFRPRRTAKPQLPSASPTVSTVDASIHVRYFEYIYLVSVTPRFRMNLSTPSFDDIDMMSRKSYVLLETLRLEFTEKLLGKVTGEKLWIYEKQHLHLIIEITFDNTVIILKQYIIEGLINKSYYYPCRIFSRM